MSERLNRRNFQRQLAAGVVLPLAALPAFADGPASSDQKPDKPAGPDKSTAEKPAKKAALTATELFLELVKQQYPDERLDAAALDEIRSDIAQQLSRSAVLSSFPLSNADQPAFVFSAYRSDIPLSREP
jgi:hypothetical protein